LEKPVAAAANAPPPRAQRRYKRLFRGHFHDVRPALAG
jgi:hypothetical protein